MKVIDIEKIVADYGNSVFHNDLKRIDSADAHEIADIARKLGLADDYVFDDTGYHLDVSSVVESLKEAVEEDKLETFEDKMNFLAKDEQEAIDGYDKVIAMLDTEKDAVVIEQLNKIKVEEEAHKKYLEEVQSNHDLVYTEPLEQEEVKEGAEGHKVPGKEYVIYDCSLENEKKAPIVAIRSTYTEAQWYCNKPGNFDRDLGIDEVPVGKFKKGDDFYGPFDGDWNKIEEAKEGKVIDTFEMPVETYTKPEDLIRINDELDKKAREGKLIGIRKEKKLLQLAEPAINGIWNIYLNDKGFIEKIVLF